jgi:acyl dehydratase
MGTAFASPGELLDAAGRDLGTTEWTTLTQERIDEFAAATGDHQWIHVDVERAKAGPFGATIAHGYLTLSLCAPFLGELAQVGGISMGINYGIDRARFVAPVPAGARVRGHGEVVSATEVTGGVQAVVRITIELEGSDKPAAVVDTVSRYLV